MEMQMLKPGFTYTRVDSKCPHCGKVFSQDLDSSVNEISTDDVKDYASDIKASPEASTMPNLSVRWYKMIKALVALPFTTKEEYATERNQKRSVRWKFWK
ncbi:Uncharacterised protein [Serratia rubidaea]|nr:Uncharacterised protein [Serratia rubidaea]